MSKNISVVGTGYVGLITSVCFAYKGHNVVGVDISEDIVSKLNNKIPTIYEKDLDVFLENAVNSNKFKATTDLDYAVYNTDITFVAVGTPSKEDGSIDLSYIEEVSKSIGKSLKNKRSYHVVVIKSTVLPETTEGVVKRIIESYSGKKVSKDFGLVMNPEFLREGRAIEDFLNPDRIVIGASDDRAYKEIYELYKDFDSEIIKTDLKTAEMIKYVSNSFLATKISFSNEIGNLCKKLGIDSYRVMDAVGLDYRISRHFLNSGIGFGGSCFPKDVKALISKYYELNEKPYLLESVLKVNEIQPRKIIDILRKYYDINSLDITVLGISFKANTDDVRESPALKVINLLLDEGAFVHAYDPKAKCVINHRNYKRYEEIHEALDKSDVVLILTEWSEFKDTSLYKDKSLVLEGRRVITDNLKDINAEGVCW